jgi:hypothetical protein
VRRVFKHLRRVFKNAFVETADQLGLVPVIDMRAQRVAQADGGGTDDLAMAGDIGQSYAGNDSLATGGQETQAASPGSSAA